MEAFPGPQSKQIGEYIAVMSIQSCSDRYRGDTVIIHVTNSLDVNGSSIHWHGVRQNWTNPSDGVPSITQCPTAPGDTMTYTWQATQYGSSWYHSHYSMQAWDGVFGGILIHGPATADYDYDLGNLFLTDWDHLTASAMYDFVQYTGPPYQDSGFINGTYSDSYARLLRHASWATSASR